MIGRCPRPVKRAPTWRSSRSFLDTLRCVIASLFLVGLLLRSGETTTRGLNPAAVRVFLILGFCGLFLSMQLTYIAIYFTTAANVVILSAATPVLVAVVARVYLGERLARIQWAGVAASAFGVILIITNGRAFSAPSPPPWPPPAPTSWARSC